MRVIMPTAWIVLFPPDGGLLTRDVANMYTSHSWTWPFSLLYDGMSSALGLSGWGQLLRTRLRRERERWICGRAVMDFACAARNTADTREPEKKGNNKTRKEKKKKKKGKKITQRGNKIERGLTERSVGVPRFDFFFLSLSCVPPRRLVPLFHLARPIPAIRETV